jgi:hypothetical protein
VNINNFTFPLAYFPTWKKILLNDHLKIQDQAADEAEILRGDRAVLRDGSHMDRGNRQEFK